MGKEPALLLATLATEDTLEVGPIVRVLPVTLMHHSDALAKECRRAAVVLLAFSLFRIGSIEGLAGCIGACVFLCCKGGSGDGVRAAAHRARNLRHGALITAVLSLLGCISFAGMSTVLIPRMGSTAESLCVARSEAALRPQHTARADLSASTTTLREVWIVTACPGRMLSATSPSWLGDSLAEVFLPSGVPTRQHCHTFGSSAKIAGSVGLLLLLFFELALGLTAVHAYLSASRLVAFVNAAGPNAV